MPTAPDVRIKIIVDARGVPRGEHLRDRLDTAAERHPGPPVEMQVLPFHRLDRSAIERSTAIVFLDVACDGDAIRRTSARIRAILDLPMIRIGGETESGSIGLPADVAPETLLATIRGLAHRTPEIRRLREELEATTLVAEGVRAEIARIDEELRAASMVQREFLPRDMPDVDGVRVAALWRPAGYVSGDIFDVFRLDQDRIGLFLADAVGHGVPAALMTMLICRSLPTRELLNDGSHRVRPPGEALAALNAFMVARQGRQARFATAAYVIYDVRRRIANIASAGHPPVLHLPPPGSGTATREIGSTGGLLGVFPDAEFDVTEVEIAPEEAIVVHSDGFEQAFPEATVDPMTSNLPNERYRSIIDEAGRSRDPDTMIARVRERLDGHEGSLHQTDDLTMICLRTGTPTLSRRDPSRRRQLGRSTRSSLTD
ncbi:MAG: hypothetical protein CMJ54_02380 [Planctomycetaceae bacterium]|nr:hypothetical protein [Planctomycetaceae bacterium]